MKEWEKLKRVRTDMSDYLLHCTRPPRGCLDKSKEASETFKVLKSILYDGFLKASFAERIVNPGRNTSHKKPTIEGPYPAVCFTAQPLQFFIQSVEVNYRYTKFAIAVRKDKLFYYGGRPVIYSDRSMLSQLDDEHKYLWASYDPTALWKRGDPVDFTHEREWRARPRREANEEIGLDGQEDVVPIHLVPLTKKMGVCCPSFCILVDTEDRKTELKSWIYDKYEEIHQKGQYWVKYSIALLLSKVQNRIFSFEEIQNREPPLRRLEDLIQSRAESD